MAKSGAMQNQKGSRSTKTPPMVLKCDSFEGAKPKTAMMDQKGRSGRDTNPTVIKSTNPPRRPDRVK